MTPTSAGIQLSASDLSRFLGCGHRTGLDLAVALGQLEAPTRVDPALELLQERGLAHEKAYVERISGNGARTADLSGRFVADAVARTREAMEAGLDLVIQAALRNGNWFGRGRRREPRFTQWSTGSATQDTGWIRIGLERRRLGDGSSRDGVADSILIIIRV